MTTAPDVVRDARRLRVLVAVAFVACVVAPGVSTWLALRHDSAPAVASVAPARVVPALFPPESPDVSGGLVAEVTAVAGARSLHGSLQVGRGDGSWHLELLCDSGSAAVTAGALSLSIPCNGRVQNLATIPLPPDGSLAVSVSVDVAQQAAWGVGAYR